MSRVCWNRTSPVTLGGHLPSSEMRNMPLASLISTRTWICPKRSAIGFSGMTRAPMAGCCAGPPAETAAAWIRQGCPDLLDLLLTLRRIITAPRRVSPIWKPGPAPEDAAIYSPVNPPPTAKANPLGAGGGNNAVDCKALSILEPQHDQR